MNCKKVLSRLQAFVDGELPAKVMSEIEEHLGSCPACRSQVERIRGIGDILDNLSVPPLPEGFTARVMAEARRRAPITRRKRFFSPAERLLLRWLLDLSVPVRLAACTMVLLACFLGVFMSKELSVSWNQQSSTVKTESPDGFEWFSATPPASLSSAYLAVSSNSTDDEHRR